MVAPEYSSVNVYRIESGVVRKLFNAYFLFTVMIRQNCSNGRHDVVRLSMQNINPNDKLRYKKVANMTTDLNYIYITVKIWGAFKKC